MVHVAQLLHHLRRLGPAMLVNRVRDEHVFDAVRVGESSSLSASCALHRRRNVRLLGRGEVRQQGSVRRGACRQCRGGNRVKHAGRCLLTPLVRPQHLRQLGLTHLDEHQLALCDVATAVRVQHVEQELRRLGLHAQLHSNLTDELRAAHHACVGRVEGLAPKLVNVTTILLRDDFVELVDGRGRVRVECPHRRQASAVFRQFLEEAVVLMLPANGPTTLAEVWRSDGTHPSQVDGNSPSTGRGHVLLAQELPEVIQRRLRCRRPARRGPRLGLLSLAQLLLRRQRCPEAPICPMVEEEKVFFADRAQSPHIQGLEDPPQMHICVSGYELLSVYEPLELRKVGPT
mmetsp:Transcript_18043/g.50114  ORF Transcript_18043/g.50114 Transcript_18043/m.50114 type:complete len:345 (+) Transcript_18043:402-1436(+)